MYGGEADKAEENGRNNSLRGKKVDWHHMRVQADDEVQGPPPPLDDGYPGHLI